MDETPNAKHVFAALLAVYLIWGSTYLAIKFALPSYPPFLLTGTRMLIAGGLMLAWLWYKKTPLPKSGQWKSITVLALVMTVLCNAFVNVAEQTVSSGVVAIGVAAMPLWAGLFSAMRGYHPSRLEWTGIVLGFLGVIWLNIGSELRVSTVGLLCVLAAPLGWAWGSMWSKGRDLPGSLALSAWQMAIGSVMSLTIGFAIGERFTHTPTVEATMAMLYLALFGSIIAYSAFVLLIKYVRPALATSYAYVNPPIALFLGYFLLNEPVNSHTVVAMILIIVSIVIVTLGKHLHARN